jgi:hypothetical protein
MPSKSQKRKTTPAKRKKVSAARQYTQFFVPAVSPLWKNGDDGFYFEQPSPLEYFPSETTYGVGMMP